MCYICLAISSLMDIKRLLITLGFSPKENAVNVFSKKYQQAEGYYIEVNLEKQNINYGEKIQIGRDTCLNLGEHHEENAVTLECVDKLLSIGYKPENIRLEEPFRLGRNSGSGWLDIIVTREDGTAYLMVECKTYGEEYDKELKNIQKNGGQLFTYFQQNTKAELLMLYSSDLIDNKVVPEYKIIKIEEEFRSAGNIKNVFKLWNKKFHEQGFWENPPYNFQLEKFTKGDLKELTEEKGEKLFHGFATILRKHSVSDKPNAFNVIFNLFLAKLYDEQKRDDVELEFQWKNDDNPVDFQVRLYNLHKDGLLDFLKKEIEGIKEEDFDAKLSIEERYNAKKKFLKFNKLFDIKSVMDDDDFEQNHRVLKEVVKLIEKYQIRYPRKQKYLSEFFELLLTTGLKQEVGQYFTPPPIAKFIVKSLPLHKMIEQEANNASPKLPAVIDFAVGSGHFITEIMEEYQDIIKDIDVKKVKYSSAENEIISWQINPYSWASRYIYGIEKDYRLVKVAKVGCYFYGDGLAQIIHGDGLDSLTNPPKSYIGLLKENTNTEDSAKNKFSVVVANPPYSVKYCKEDLEYTGSQKDFTLYPYLNENGNEIECLFVERTKQFLKDGGVAGIILPSSILSNEGIYTKTREIILKYFEIIAITELGSNTFMATGTNTIVLFLRRRNNSDSIKLEEFVEKFFVDFQDNNPPKPFNIVDLEKPFSKYVNYVWESVNLADYISLIKNKPNENIQNHEFYKTYRKSVNQKIESEIAKAQKNRKTQLSEENAQKIKDRIEKEFFNNFIETEKEKLLHFILAYNQKVVLVNTGKGNDEKRFLGYEFSNAKGNEGIHPIQRGKSIDECTKLYNEKEFEDKTKTSFYIYKAFLLKNDEQYPEIDESLKNNISRVRLVDMLTFDRAGFAKNISTAIKKKVRIESKWELVKIGQVATTQYGFTDKASDNGKIRYLRITDLNDDGSINLDNEKKFINPNEEIKRQFLLRNNDVIIARSGSVGKSAIYKSEKYADMIFASYLIRLQVNEDKILPEYLFYFTKTQMYWNQVEVNSIAVTQPNLNAEKIKEFQIPLPPKEIQEKIVAEIEVLEKKEAEAKEKIEKGKEKVENICLQVYAKYDKEKLNKLAKTNPSKIEIADLDTNTLVSFVDMPSVSNDGYIANKVDKPYYEINKGSYTYFRENDIIIAKITPCMENGKCALATNLTNGLAMGSSEFHVIRTNNDKISTKYLFTLLNRKSIRIEAEKNMTGASGHRRVPIAFYENLEIPVPPLSEQQKIVFEIEKIETQIAELEHQLSKMPQKKEAVLKKYL